MSTAEIRDVGRDLSLIGRIQNSCHHMQYESLRVQSEQGKGALGEGSDLIVRCLSNKDLSTSWNSA